MITQIFQLFFVVPVAMITRLVLDIIPDVHFLTTNGVLTPIGSAFQWFFGVMASLDPIIPYHVQLTILTVIFTYYATLFTFRLVSWILRKIPLVGIS